MQGVRRRWDPSSVEYQEGRVRSPGGRAAEEKHWPGDKKSRFMSRPCSPFPPSSVPSGETEVQTLGFSFPICKMRPMIPGLPTSQLRPGGELGRTQDVTGQDPTWESDSLRLLSQPLHFPWSSTTFSEVRILPALGSSTKWGGSLFWPDGTAVTIRHINGCH